MTSPFAARFTGTRAPIWNSLGSVNSEGQTAEALVTKLGLDTPFISAPIGYDLPDGTFVKTEDRVAVLRTPTAADPQYRRMGIVSGNYRYLQNLDIARGVDVISSQTGWAVENAGALYHGALFFIALNAGNRSVRGDEYAQYFMVADGKASGQSLAVSVIPYRINCANAIQSALSSASIAVKIPHSVGVEGDYGFWLGLVASLESSRDAVFGELEHMTKRRISLAEAREIFAIAWPYPVKNQRLRILEQNPNASDEIKAALEPGKEAYEAEVTWANRQRESAETLFERFNDNAEQGGKLAKVVHKKIAGTPYAALQAVTELVDWGGSGKAESAAQTALFGYKANTKRRAWSAALSLADGHEPEATVTEDAMAAEAESL